MNFWQKYGVYLLRWQLSTPILAVVLWWLGGLNVWVATVIANLIGGLLFFWVDRWIFNQKRETKSKEEKND
jgi:membrane protein implicated in regulation of membrane protease activity